MVNVRQKYHKWKSQQTHLVNTSSSEVLDAFNKVPFWIWDPVKHKIEYEKSYNKNLETCTCCAQHILGLPEKEHIIGRTAQDKPIIETKTHPLYPWQRPIIESILNYDPTASIKATGMGNTTMTLGLMTWLCLKDDEFVGDSQGIVTGPRVDLAKEEISRIPRLFQNLDYAPEQISNQVTINHCPITAYPSHTFDSARGLDRIRFFFADECDFFPIGQQVRFRHVIERYWGKTHPMTFLNSTPGLPGGTMDTLEHESPQPSYDYQGVKGLTVLATDTGYKIFRLPYTLGIGKIYTDYEIEIARKSPSFEREYNLQYGIGIGNIFNPKLVDACIADYPLSPQGGVRVLEIDPAFGDSETSSNFGILGFEKRSDGIKYVVHAEQRHRASPEAMYDTVVNIYTMGKFHVCECDEAWPGVIRDLNKGSEQTKRKPIPVSPKKSSGILNAMTTHATTEVQNDQVRIHYGFTDLIGQLKAIEFNEKGVPDKKKLTFDIGDCFIYGLDYWRAEAVMRKVKTPF